MHNLALLPHNTSHSPLYHFPANDPTDDEEVDNNDEEVNDNDNDLTTMKIKEQQSSIGDGNGNDNRNYQKHGIQETAYSQK